MFALSVIRPLSIWSIPPLIVSLLALSCTSPPFIWAAPSLSALLLPLSSVSPVSIWATPSLSALLFSLSLTTPACNWEAPVFNFSLLLLRVDTPVSRLAIPLFKLSLFLFNSTKPSLSCAAPSLSVLFMELRVLSPLLTSSAPFSSASRESVLAASCVATCESALAAPWLPEALTKSPNWLAYKPVSWLPAPLFTTLLVYAIRYLLYISVILASIFSVSLVFASAVRSSAIVISLRPAWTAALVRFSTSVVIFWFIL